MNVTQYKYKWQEGVPNADIIENNKDALKTLFKLQQSKSCNRDNCGFFCDRLPLLTYSWYMELNMNMHV